MATPGGFCWYPGPLLANGSTTRPKQYVLSQITAAKGEFAPQKHIKCTLLKGIFFTLGHIAHEIILQKNKITNFAFSR
jgi:hypothetical protein